ncbi:MAG: hypothetical protein R3F33_14725 [Planctomycetota bacterium]
MFDMPILDLAASAAAVLLFLFAARSFVTGSNREPLGWGFGLASGIILAWLLKEPLGGFGNGLRLGLGILLVMPALHALVDPGKSSVVSAIVGLFMAFAVARGPVNHLRRTLGPETPATQLVAVQNELATLGEQRVRVKKTLSELVLRKEELKREIRSLGLGEKELLKHPKVSLLAALVETQAKWDRTLVQLDSLIQAKELRLQALQANLEMDRMGQDNPELRDLLQGVDSDPLDPDQMGLIERSIHQDRLREILERELP